MSSFTDYLEGKIMGHVFTGEPYTAPATIYVALFTAAPSEAGGGTEVTGGAYIRKAVTLQRTGNTVTNSATVEWPSATANWGTITHGALFDAPTGGNMMAQAPLTSARVIESSDVFRLPTADLVITLD